ncbi:sushi, von Willebrand factor type A, EGF and pentraxin domain-containing protein 1-like [Porites lutea]|uniref:sushi, von Willebrand factor type A, EGF and pentraxin domain-containing protein 1-like n=1 Tax=Porites lutea TaxID=51062 RepID=UPI003CC6B26A
MNAPESPFYLAVGHNRRSNEEVWYMNAPLGKNEIGKFLSTAAKTAGLHSEGKKVTNHSVRKTCISRRLDAHVSDNFVAQLSGHKSRESLQSYKSASAKDQKRISLTLSRADLSGTRNEALSTVECGDPGKPTNGEQIVKKGYVYGGSVKFVCDKNYTLVGTDVIYCQANRSWSSYVPRCLANCRSPGEVHYGLKIGNNYTHGKKVRYSCNLGYTLEGEAELSCVDGRWSTATPKCKAVECGNPGKPTNGKQIVRKGYVYGGSVEFFCDKNYTLVGTDVIYCQANRSWSSSVPRCLANCRSPGDINHGLKIGNNYTHGKRVRYSCNLGYTLEGEAELTCVDGRWNIASPKCKAVECGIPGKPTNGKQIVRKGYVYGGSVKFFCDKNYTLVGSDVIYCQANRSWSSSVPRCLANCRSPGDINHGLKIGNNYTHRKRVRYSCNLGYTLEGEAELTCVDGRWNTATPKCKAVECGNPGKLTNGKQIVRKGYVYGGSVKFVCDKNYTLVGTDVIYCQANRSWSSSLPRCVGKCHGPSEREWAEDDSNCRSPGEVHYGLKIGNNYTHGKKVRYSCNLGYTLEGEAELSCVDGRWSTATPKCKAVECGDPGKPANGKQIVKKGYVYNGSVKFACEKNYTLVGTDVIYCQANRSWSSSVPRCLANCRSPGDLHHGLKIGNNYTHGKTVRYSCNLGYTLEGEAELACVDGRWNTATPKCKAVECGDPGKPANGKQIVKKGYVYGGSVKFVCDKNYTLVGIDVIYCQANRSWSSSLPRCLANCRSPGDLHHGLKIGNNCTHGKTVRYSCNHGYTLEGEAELTCVDGRWNTASPKCKAVECGNPGKPTNGKHIVRKGYVYGGSVEFFCDKNYTLVGTDVIYCQANRSWSSSVPRCLADCGSPSDINHGLKIGNNYTHGKRVRYSCNLGYTLEGEAELTCVDGRWNTATPKCKAVECGNPGKPTNGKQIVRKGYVYGGSVEFVCDKNYTLVGTDVIYCQANRSWSSSLPRCVANCRSPGVLNHGLKIGNNYTHGKTVRYSCNLGYTLEGEAELSCVDGRWNTATPKCKAVECGDPGKPANGKQIVKKGYVYGGSVKFACEKNYTLVGTDVIYCQANRSWSSSVPRCLANCRSPGDLHHGLKIGNNYTHGKTVRYSCNLGYTLEGEAELSCVDGRWNTATPKCKAVECGNPGKPTNGKQIVRKGYVYGGSVKFFCDKNYTLVGTDVIYCQANRSWSSPRPRCVANCRSPADINHGLKIGDNYKHGKTVRYSCNAGFTLEGEAEVTCEEGTWNTDTPKCKAVECGNPGKPTNGRQIVRKGYVYGGSVKFVCDKNYTLVGTDVIYCQANRSWSSSVPRCLVYTPRLIGGRWPGEGRVEIYYSGTWGTVCDDNWDENAARVVCRQLGYPSAVSAPNSARFGRGSGKIWLDDVQCQGNESSIVNCRHSPWGEHNCGHNEDASVICSTNLRLIGGSGPGEGRVEIYYRGTWGTVCDDNWDKNDARAVCRQLGYSSVVSAPRSARFGQGSGKIWLDDVQCQGNESSIVNCRHSPWGEHNCGHHEDASVICSTTLRLTGGSGPGEGRVEIYYSGSWGTVCDDNWDQNDARVVCRQLGYLFAVSAPHSARFGQGSGKIWLDDVQCQGNEGSIVSCRHNPWGVHNCGHNEDASVICSTTLRLIGGNWPGEGRVEIYYNDTWGTVCDDNWDKNDARVVCRQLGYSFAVSAPHSSRFGQGSGKIWLDDVQCQGNEGTIVSCRHNPWGVHNCGHNEDASVICSRISSVGRKISGFRLRVNVEVILQEV